MMLYGPRGILTQARARRRQDGERGQILVLFTLVIVLLMVLSAIVIDVGLLRTDGARLQNALDAGALAAAQGLPANSTNVAQVRSTATSYTQANFRGLAAPQTTFACLIGLVDATGLPRLTDMPSICNVPAGSDWQCTGIVCWAPCSPEAGNVCNTVILKDDTTRQYTFGRAVGINSGSTGTLVSAACTGACGGPPTTPVDVVLTIDRTGSMRGLETTLVGGAQAVLKAYDPEVQHVALGMIGPSSQVTACSTGAFGKVLINGTTAPSIAGSTTANVQSAGNATGGAVTLVINKPTATAAGDLMVAGITFNGGSGVATVTPPLGWTLILRTNNGANVGMASYYKVAAAGEPSNYIWGLSSSARASGGILRYTGVDVSHPIDVSGGATGNDTTSPYRVTAPAVTTTTVETALVGFYGIATGTTYSGNSALTERFDARNPNGAGPSTQGATGTEANAGSTGTDYGTAGAGGQWVAQHIAIRPIPGESYPVGYPTTSPPYTEAFIAANMKKWIPVGLSGASNAKVIDYYVDVNTTPPTLNPNSPLVKTIGCVLPPNALYNGTDQASPFDFGWRYLRDNARLDPKTGNRVKTGIIFETDGTPQLQNYTCQQAQTAASAAKAFGAEVYTIGFFASNQAGDRCPDSSGAWRGKTVIQSLAAMATDSVTVRTNACDTNENSDGDHFFCTPDPAQLDDVFRAAAVALAGGSRLIQTYPTPVVTSVGPASGTIAGGTTVNISGKYFLEAYSVTFGGRDAASFRVNSATSITAVSPAGAVGTVDIQVSTPGGSSKIVAVDHYTYTSP
jgi:hypothetical protein